jgi:Mce-associated membrane protein
MTTLSDNTESASKADAARRDEEVINADAKDSVEAMSQEIEPTESDDPDALREKRSIAWSRVVAYGVLPGFALLLALAAGYFKWVDDSGNDVARARTESVRVASEDAVALLSYKPDTVDRDLGAARERLTGEFKDAYTALTREVVIPGAKEKHISAAAKVNAAASVSATANHAVVLLFVNQTVTIGQGVPTDTQPVIRVTLDKVNGRWLVSRFDPT